MIQAEVVERRRLQRNLQGLGDVQELLPGSVADADTAAAQSLPDQCLGHDSDRIGEVDEPGAGGKLGRFAGVSREDGDGAHGQGEPAGADRFLTGEAVLERDRFVLNTAREPAHANARNDERSPVQSRFQGRGPRYAQRSSYSFRHGLRDAGDGCAAPRVGVEQRQLAYGQGRFRPEQAVDHQRDTDAGPADNGQFHFRNNLRLRFASTVSSISRRSNSCLVGKASMPPGERVESPPQAFAVISAPSITSPAIHSCRNPPLKASPARCCRPPRPRSPRHRPAWLRFYRQPRPSRPT